MRLIVSRHKAAIEFIRQELPEFRDAEVLSEVTADQVRGKVVAGNLPLHLAALAAEVIAVEFSGTPPRGQEYGVEEMKAAGARLSRYKVFAADPPAATITWSDKPGNRGRQAHLILRKEDTLYQFVGESIPEICVVLRWDYKKMGGWSHSIYELRLGRGVAVAFSGHSGWETRTIMESLNAHDWASVATALGMRDTPAFREFFRRWRTEDSETLDTRERELAALPQ